MPTQYMIHALCDECRVPHPTGLVIWSDEAVDPTQNVADLYDGREEPKELVAVQNRRFRCPLTGHIFRPANNRKLFLVGVAMPALSTAAMDVNA